MPTPRRAATAAAPAERVRALPVGGLLDWRDGAHWSTEARPCWHCGSSTHLRDDRGKPSCKVCAEAELADIDRIVSVYSGQARL
jgi:hypothetical protein